jgi:hypothetical protein
MSIEIFRLFGLRGPLARSFVFVGLALTVSLMLACGGNSATAVAEREGQVRGLVVEVVGRSITEVESLRVRDEAGKVWSFSGAEGFIGTTPSHVREHQLMGSSVLVTYVREGSTLVALDISD